MDVRVDEPGERVQALGLDDLRAVRRVQRRADLGDPPVPDEHIAHPVEAGARVEQPRAAHQHRGGPRARAVELDGRARPEAVPGSSRGAHAGWGSVSAPACTPPGAPRPASSSYNTAIRTTTPDSTCSAISACGESITSAASSTPRFTGPGCIRSCDGPSRRPSIWYRAAYSRSEGTNEPAIRSRCIRSA